MGDGGNRHDTTIKASDAADLEWLFSGGGARQVSNVGSLVARLVLYSEASQACYACGGQGMRGARPLSARKRARAEKQKQVLQVIELDHLVDESNRDMAQADRACSKCKGSGRRSGRSRTKESRLAWPLLGGTTDCKPCNGVAGVRACERAERHVPRCGGNGFYWFTLVGHSETAQAGAVAYGESDPDMGRAGRIWSRLAAACAIYPRTIKVLVAYYGDDGCVAGDRIIALYPETAAGKRLLAAEANPNNLGPLQRIRADVEADATSSRPERRRLIEQAHEAALRDYGSAARAWNSAKEEA